jgi:uncharacterized membrane protein YphA (DoxX/SURF4 family)
MQMNPFYDVYHFLMRGEWPVYLFRLLLLGGGIAAGYNLSVDASKRTIKDLWMCLARILLGCMWWQQTLWKLPPYYTDLPAVPDSGLKHWMIEMINSAAFSLQSAFVKDIVLPYFYLFAPMVYAIESFIGASLILGLFTRLGGILGGLMAINLWLGLYNSQYEWPWTYFFLILLQFTFGLLRTGRNLGCDSIIVRRLSRQSEPEGIITRLITWAT